MSVHKDCGEDIRWVKREDEEQRWMPPLEFIGQVYIIDESGHAFMTNAYQIHNCDPDKMEAWQEYQRRIAELKGDQESIEELDGRQVYQIARERERERVWELALTRPCRTCQADIGQRCISQSVHLRRTGEIKETLNPHPSRLEP